MGGLLKKGRRCLYNLCLGTADSRAHLCTKWVAWPPKRQTLTVKEVIEVRPQRRRRNDRGRGEARREGATQKRGQHRRISAAAKSWSNSERWGKKACAGTVLRMAWPKLRCLADEGNIAQKRASEESSETTPPQSRSRRPAHRIPSPFRSHRRHLVTADPSSGLAVAKILGDAHPKRPSATTSSPAADQPRTS